MRSHIAAVALIGATALLTGTPSLATTTGAWTVTPGGAATATSGTITLTDVVTGKLINDGDRADFSATYTVHPRQVITSP